MVAQAADREAFRAKTLEAIPEVYPQAVAAGHQQDVGAASLHFSSGGSNSIGVCARPSKKRYLGCKISRGWLVKKIQDPHKDTRLSSPGYKKQRRRLELPCANNVFDPGCVSISSEGRGRKVCV